jgi:RimJ/RimL family protein N-acetyltransferase
VHSQISSSSPYFKCAIICFVTDTAKVKPTFRIADAGDTGALLHIEHAAFPEGDPDRKSAIDGQIEQGISSGQILVCTDAANQVIAFIEFHQIGVGRGYFVEGVAVDVKWRGQGLSTIILRELTRYLKALTGSRQHLSMTVSPKNQRMLTAALHAGFYGVEYFDDYFGPGEGRIYLRNQAPVFASDDHPIFVPVASFNLVAHRIGESLALCDIEPLPQGPSYCLKRVAADETATFNTSETSVSMNISTALLAAFTFMFALSIASRGFPISLYIMLGYGLLSSAFAMLVYANGVGVLSRVQDGSFNHHMQVGNAISEFGGFYVLFFVVPASVALLTHSYSVGIPFSALSSIGLFMYQYSGMSMIDRYHWPVTVRNGVKVLAALAPVLFFIEARFHYSTKLGRWQYGSLSVWIWSCLAFLTGLMIAAIYSHETPST